MVVEQIFRSDAYRKNWCSISIYPIIFICIFIFPLNSSGFEKKNLNLPFIFFKEKVNITLNEGEMIVEGDYYFRNLRNGSSNGIILYPLPSGKTMPFPYLIEVEGKKLVKSRAGVHWLMSFQKKNEVQKVRVIYKQKLLESQSFYIVESTRKWGIPLEHAEFNIDYPASWSDFNTSYQMQTLSEGGDRKQLQFARTDFWPGKNMIFSWK